MKLIKWLLWVVLFLVVIAVGAAIFLITKVDPNDLKPQISQKVESLTGRKLSLNGDLAWQFYPWVGVTLNDFALSNREGFAPEHMLEAAQVDVQLKLIPLLSKQLKIGKIILVSPKINLSVNQQGETNWDDLATKGGAPAPVTDSPEQAAGAMLGGLVVQGVDISDGEISWDDKAAGQSYRLSDFNISTGNIEPGKPVVFDMRSGVSGTGLPADAQVQLKGTLLLNEAMDALKLSGLSTQLSMDDTQAKIGLASLNFSLDSGLLDIDKLTAQLSMDQLSTEVEIAALNYALESQTANLETLVYSGKYDIYPFKGEVIDLAFDVNSNTLKLGKYALGSEYNRVPLALAGAQLQVDLDKETLNAPGLAIELGEARLNLELQASQLMGDAQASGHLVSNKFNPKLLATELGLDALADLPETAMQSLKLETDFSGGLSFVVLGGLQLELDKSNLTGEFSMQDFEKPAYRFNLKLDQINVDDYTSEATPSAAEQGDNGEKSAKSEELAQDSSSSASASSAPGGPAATALPFAELKGLDVQGEIAIGELRIQDLVSNDVLVKIGAESDRIEISPLRARVYGGETSNTLVYDVSGDVPSIDIASELLRLDMGAFLKALQISDRFEGFGSVTAKLSSSALLEDELVSNLNGAINIKLSDGAIRGVDLQGSLIEAEALVKQLSGKNLGLSADLGDKTEFSEFGSDITIDRGVMTVRSINMKAPAIRVVGGGTVDLNTEQLDLALEVSVVESFEGQGGATLDKLKGQTIPMKITGSMDSPSILPDFSKLLQKELERQITKKYLGEGESGESLSDALNRKLNEKLAKELGQEPPAPASSTTSGTTVESAPEAKAADPAPVVDEEPLTDKQKARKQLKKEGAKLLQGLFGG
jgi:AsmA protein